MKFQSVFLLALCISVLSIIVVSQASWVSLSALAPGAKDGAKVTCPVALNQCSSECNRRCSATSHKSACLEYCNKCCDKCLCVPPGTYGQKECCPCYNDWKTKKGGPKCP